MQSAQRIHVPSLLQVILSAFGLLSNLSVAGGVFVVGIVFVAVQREAIPAFSLASTMMLMAILMLPSLLAGIWRLSSQNSSLTGQTWEDTRLAKALLLLEKRHIPEFLALLWLPFLGVGILVASNSSVNWLILPILQIFLVGVPLWLWVILGSRKLSTTSLQRKWGAAVFGLTVSPIVIIFIEVVLVIFVITTIIVWAASQPGLLQTLRQTYQPFSSANLTPQQTEEIIKTIFLNPQATYIIFALSAGVIPLLEELFKPLVLWFFVSRLHKPSQGFVLGLISGAAFGLLESLGNLVSAGLSGSDWAMLITGRLGTGILHSVCTALVGWGLVSAWSERRFARLGLAYLCAVTIHCLWNFFALLSGLSEYMPSGWALVRLDIIAPLALVVLAVSMLNILLQSNRILQKESL